MSALCSGTAAPALALPANETDLPPAAREAENEFLLEATPTLLAEVRAGDGEIWLVLEAGMISKGLDFWGGMVWLASCPS